MITRQFRVFGRVQGVGFRFFVRRAAQELGLGGWVRNCADGSVKARAAGSDAALARFRFLLQEGPPVSRVDRVEEEILEEGELQMPFEVRH